MHQRFVNPSPADRNYCHFYSVLLHCCWELKVCLNIKICKYLRSNQTNISKFHSLEVVGRGSETQLRVGENLNKFT